MLFYRELLVAASGSNCSELYTSFWTATFSTYENACLEFFGTINSEMILKQKATVQVS